MFKKNDIYNDNLSNLTIHPNLSDSEEDYSSYNERQKKMAAYYSFPYKMGSPAMTFLSTWKI